VSQKVRIKAVKKGQNALPATSEKTLIPTQKDALLCRIVSKLERAQLPDLVSEIEN